MMIKFLNILESIPETGSINNEIVRYCERFMEFVIDLEALLPTRRFFNTVLDDSHLVVRCSISPLIKRPEGKLFSQVSSFFLHKYKLYYLLHCVASHFEPIFLQNVKEKICVQAMLEDFMRFLGMFFGSISFLGISCERLSIIVAVHVRQLVAVVPIRTGSVSNWLVVAASLLEQKADVLLSNDANVENHRRLQEVRDDVNVE